MDYKIINEALKSIYELRFGKKFRKITEHLDDRLQGEERQGEYNEIVEIYSLGVEDLHIKLVLRTDSYGDNEYVYSIQIVKPVIKQVTDFQSI